MKRHCLIFLALALMAELRPASAAPLKWSCNWPEAKSQTFSLYHGESAQLQPSFYVNGVLATNLTIEAAYYQTNGMADAWWELPGATFAPSNDCGAASYRFFVRAADAAGVNYRANGVLRMLDSPGFTPSEVALPIRRLDFDTVELVNAPYYTKDETDAKIVELSPPADLSQATNYTDSAVTSATNGLLRTETDPTVPSWAKAASKPSYILNEICPETENWLGVQGNAGRHIKVLAGTVGGQIVGGLRVTASAQNDNNMTTYTYGGVAVRRNGVNTDYVFDETSDNGIVRRSELASLAPATNIARSALAQDVQASLDKADSALQTAPVTSVNNKTGAVALSASDVGVSLVRISDGSYSLVVNSGSVSIDAIHFTHPTGVTARLWINQDYVDIPLPAVPITIDLTPVYHSENAVSSGGVYDALDLKAPLASPAFTGTPTAPTPTAGDNSTKVATTAFVQEAISGTAWSATNTVAVIARHTGKETVSIPSGGNLVADLSGWNDGVQTFIVLQPSGAYTVASNVEYCGYGTWPTNTALCVAWPYAGTLYVNPITIIRE